jgi:hypothetical protein
MTINPILSSGDYTKLRADRYIGDTYVSVLTPVVVYSGLLSATPSGSSITELSVDTTSGLYSNVVAGMRIQVAVDSAYSNVVYDGRIRKIGGSGSTLYISETSREMLNNYRFRVLNDFPILPRKPRISGGDFLVDYDQAFEQLPPLVGGIQNVYAGFLDGGVFTVTLAPNVTAAADGATISTYEWDVDDGTITSGTSASKDITVTFEEGERWLHFTVTDSNGSSIIRHILVLSYADEDSAGLLREFENVSVTNAVGEGQRADLTTYADLSGWLTRQLVVVWTADNYDGDTTPLDGNIAFYGRRNSVTDAVRYNDTGQADQSTTLTLDGTIAQASEGIAFPATLEDVESAVDWFQLKTLNMWRAMAFIATRFSTLAEVAGIGFDETDDEFLFGDLDTQGATVWEQIVDIASSIGAEAIETRDGRVIIQRQAVLLEEADDRLNVDTTAAWGDQDYFSLSLREEDIDTVAAVTMYSGSFNTATGTTEAYQTIAPGEGGGEGSANITVNRQVLASGANSISLQQARKRAGNLYEQQRQRNTLTVEHPDGYWWMLPEVRAWNTFSTQAGGLLAYDNIEASTRWIRREVRVDHNAIEGTRNVTGVYTRETEGREGAYIPPVLVESSPYTPPDPVVYPEPELGITPSELPLADVDGGSGSYNEDDEVVEDACDGTGSLDIGGWDFNERCVIEQGISIGYSDLVSGTLTMVLSLDGSPVKTSSWDISGTQVLVALDDEFADSIRADRVDVSIAFDAACSGGGLRIFGIRVNEDQFSDGCQDTYPEIHDFGEQILTARGQVVNLGTLPYNVVAVALRVDSLVAVPGDCGFGRAGTGQLQANGSNIISVGVNIEFGETTAFVERGDTQFTQVLVDAGLIPDAGVGAVSVYNRGTVFRYRAGDSTVNPNACYPIKVHAWAIVDLASGA